MSTPADLVDLARYPILDLEGAALREVLAWARRQLRDTGACEVPAFLTPAGLATIRDDALALAPTAHRSEVRVPGVSGYPLRRRVSMTPIGRIRTMS